jgi:predicted unusual protein kinase regulating ubiquinone biosynthesis (AarF/ABC1/UbiB family)
MGKKLVGVPAHLVLTDVQRRTAEHVFAVLGQLKGGAMKFGQAMSIFEAALPEEIVGPYRQVLTKLQDSAPPMPASVVHRILAEEFGTDWQSLLVAFEDLPAASASIGQVHRATWHDGREAAVKLQYPGAAKALRSDLRQIARLSKMIAGFVPGIDIVGLVDELQERATEELDYSLESAAQEAFAVAYADDPDVAVPEVLAHTERALVSTWLESERSLAGVIADGGQLERDFYGQRYVRFLIEGPRRTGMLHADPHPGNFRILPDGRLGVVDYGAVARLPDGLPTSMGHLLRRAVEDDYDAVVEGLAAEGFFLGDRKLGAEAMRRFMLPFVEPAREPEFSFSREWLREQTARVSLPGSQDFTIALKINLPREYLLIHRVWAGGIGVLCQLGATAPFRGILQESLPGFADDPEHG